MYGFIKHYVHSHIIYWYFLKHILFCRTALEYILFILFTDALRFITGPMNAKYCFIKTIWRSSYVTTTMLHFDFIALTRYLFIFHLKNPFVFKDNFWIVFVNIWVRGASIIFNAAWFYQAEHQIINYYLCSGIDPTEDFKKPLKLYATTELGSILINLFVYIRIKFYKMRHQEKAQPSQAQQKYLFLSGDMTNSIATVTTNLLNLISLILMLLGVALLSNIPPTELYNYKNEIYYVYLVSPTLAIGVFLSAYYIRHKPLRNAALIQLRDCYSHIQEYFASLK